ASRRVPDRTAPPVPGADPLHRRRLGEGEGHRRPLPRREQPPHRPGPHQGGQADPLHARRPAAARAAMNWDWPDSTITRVIDGDSLVAEVHRDLGFNGTATFRQKLRLNRINAKPAKTPEGKAATAAVIGMVTDPVHITTLKSYKYGSETG